MSDVPAAPTSGMHPAEGTGGRPLLRILAAILLVGILVLASLAFLEVRRMATIADGNLAALRLLQEQVGALQLGRRELENAQQEFDRRVSTLAEQQAAISHTLEALAADRQRSNVELALAEVEYLLIIATQRLALTRDPHTALAAMEAADKRLAGLSVQGLADVRGQIQVDMEALRQVGDVDIAGLSLYLADLAARADTLLLKHEYAVAAAPSRAGGEALSGRKTGWRGVWRSFIEELKSLVVITRTGLPEHAVLLPEERYFLIQNLRLQLETARLAVLTRDTRALRASAATVTDWIETYFDRKNDQVANAMESVGRMAELELDPELPDISSSLESVRAYIREYAGEPAESGEPGPQS